MIAQSLSDFMKPGPPRSRYTVPSAHLPLGHDSHLDHKGPELGVPARIGQEIPDDLSRSSDLHRAFNSRHQSSSSARKCLARRPIVPRPTSRATDRPGALTPCLQPRCSSRSRSAEPSKPRRRVDERGSSPRPSRSTWTRRRQCLTHLAQGRSVSRSASRVAPIRPPEAAATVAVAFATPSPLSSLQQ